MKLINNQLLNIKMIDKELGIDNAFDLGKRELFLYGRKNIIYTNNFLVSIDSVIQIIQSLLLSSHHESDDYFNTLYKNLSTISVSVMNDVNDITNEIIKGLVCIVVDNYDKTLIIDVRNYPTRGVSEPDGEKVVRGSKEGFTENFSTNIALIRRRIKSGDLRVIKYEVGNISKTEVVLVYLEKHVNKKALNNCINKIKKINVDELTMTDKALEELLTNRPYAIYPMVRYTERPDTLCIHLYQGMFGIIVDTSPSVMIAPTTLLDHFQAPEEYRQTAFSGTFLRLLRFLGIIVSFLLVPLWLCFVNEGVFDNTIITNIMNLDYSRKTILLQIIISEISIELVRMASIHTPNSLSTSMGLIVGIVLGGIAVELEIVSQAIVLLGALSAVGTYITPSYELGLANKIIKLIFILICYFFKLPGLIISVIFMFFYLLTLKSFGESYLKPLIPLNIKELIKQFIRVPYHNKKK